MTLKEQTEAVNAFKSGQTVVSLKGSQVAYHISLHTLFEMLNALKSANNFSIVRGLKKWG